ncbi:MAG: hypothetical protein GF419_03955 [Ignavibacteriales bacterium]|nr:hypothetical protein [Ignavibacteriales bacterium]
MKYVIAALAAIVVLGTARAQQEGVEAFVLESYVDPEIPDTFNLAFFSTAPAKSRLVVVGKTEFVVSDEFVEDHRAAIDISDVEFDSLSTPAYILLEDESGAESQTERFLLELPQTVDLSKSGTPWASCAFGSVFFLVPTGAYVLANEDEYWAIGKEIPLVSFWGANPKRPFGYFGVEYQHVFDMPRGNFFRYGYKHIVPAPVIEFVSFGVSGFHNFVGYNGVAGEATLGLFDLYDVFTVVARARYGLQPGVEDSDMFEASLGLYTSFFTYRF